MIKIPTDQIINPQELSATVAGPDDANTLLVLDGQLPAALGTVNAIHQETFSVLLGPVFTRPQFIKATATASIADIFISETAANSLAQMTVEHIDADWDDESGRIELRVELRVNAGPSTNVQINRISYHVTVLAAMPVQ